jgi:flavin reductase (DIM6/NTAB) family NADH-FMN oxidoreductase RutF
MDTTAASTLIAWLDRELWLVTAQAAGRRSGLIATFVGPASIVPDEPRMLVGLAKQHYTSELVEASGAFGLHLLGARHLDWVWRFGLASGRDVDKFAELEVHTAQTGSPLLASALGWLDCRVVARMDTGDRTVYIGAVVQSTIAQFGPPLRLKQAMQLAPPHKLAEMRCQRHQDSLVDAEAIRAWRQRRDDQVTR